MKELEQAIKTLIVLFGSEQANELIKSIPNITEINSVDELTKAINKLKNK